MVGAMIAWILTLLVAALFMVINVIIGCYVAIRLGYGPPDWKTALNLVVRLTTLQDRLNAGRDWLDRKAPWTDKFLDYLNVPRPIIIVDVPEEEAEIKEKEVEAEVIGEAEETGEAATEQAQTEQTEPLSEGSAEELPDPLEPRPLELRSPEADQIPLDESGNADASRADASRTDNSP